MCDFPLMCVTVLLAEACSIDANPLFSVTKLPSCAHPRNSLYWPSLVDFF